MIHRPRTVVSPPTVFFVGSTGVATEKQLDPNSLVARIIAELRANPDAQRLLLQAILTDEFLGRPVRLDRIEKDVAQLKADVAGIG